MDIELKREPYIKIQVYHAPAFLCKKLDKHILNTMVTHRSQTGAQTMQFAPWQISGALPQVWAGGLQAGTLPAGGLLAPNPIFIRGPQPDAPPSMFIQHSPQNNVQHTS